MADRQDWGGLRLGLAAVGIVGALLGYGVQHFLSFERERSKAFEDRQSAAYVAFLSAFDKDRMASEEAKAGNEKTAAKLKIEYRVEAEAAGRRIAIYGDKEVVKAMADWYRAYRSGNPPPCGKQFSAELRMWERMRDALLVRDQKVSRADLAAITAADFCEPGEG